MLTTDFRESNLEARVGTHLRGLTWPWRYPCDPLARCTAGTPEAGSWTQTNHILFLPSVFFYGWVIFIFLYTYLTNRPGWLLLAGSLQWSTFLSCCAYYYRICMGNYHDYLPRFSFYFLNFLLPCCLLYTPPSFAWVICWNCFNILNVVTFIAENPVKFCIFPWIRVLTAHFLLQIS